LGTLPHDVRILTMELISKNIEETAEIGLKFLRFVKQNSKKAVVVGLKGDLGSGKTAFVKAIAEHLNIPDVITSPTFVIQKKYPLEKRFKGFKNLMHIDAYRLKNGGDLKKIGWSEIFDNRENLIFIEWADTVEDILPKNAIEISFEFVDENTRKIKFNF